MERLGLQMYTVKPLLLENVEETLIKIKKIGYESIQLAGTIELMEQTAVAAKKLGIHVVGIMANIDQCEKEGDRLFSICKSCGATDIGIGAGAITYEKAIEFANRANSFAKIAAKEGITVSYHNHSHEFMKTENGQTVMEIYMENMKGVYFMPDTYWIQHGGADVRHVIESLKGRVKILHLKDMIRVHEGQTFAPVGYGNLYMEGIIKTAKECGVENFFVEQDSCEEDPIICVEKSYNYLKELV